MTRELAIPELSLVILIGATGSGKSTFARTHFSATEVLSSDACRGLVSDDENDQSASRDAFEVLEFIAGKRLRAGRLTVIDATNVQPDSRRSLVALARTHDVLPIAVVLDVPERVCLERNVARPDRSFGAHVVRRQRDHLRRSLKSLAREGFRTVHTLRGTDEIAAVTITRTRLYSDRHDLRGPFDAIGDVHGCRAELEQLLHRLGYTIRRDDHGRAVGAHHPGRQVIFLGDLVDRGPDTPGVLRLAMGMVAAGDAICVPGNHEDKLLRALRGRDVRISHGLAESLAQLGDEPPEFRTEVETFLDGLVSHYVLDGGRLVVAHAGLTEGFHGRASRRVRDFCLYGQTTGETDDYGLPVRHPWAQDYRGSATVLYGHTPTPTAEWVNRTLCLDTGCVFGGRLSALRYPEREIVDVPAAEIYYAPARPFPVNEQAEDPRGGSARREPDVFDITDVLDTPYQRRKGIREENAAAALEVMSRFTIDPRWLLYLPPTMSPVATSRHPGLLEHPDEAFEFYRSQGVAEVVCQEKHMGSRAVALICRSAAEALARFGTDDDHVGAVWTRTGRAFFGPELTHQLVIRLQEAAEQAGLFDELATPWLLFDAELMPWSAKAEALLREQYAAVGAAARAALPVAVTALEQAQARGIDPTGLAELTERTRVRQANADAFVDAYRRYFWPTDGLTGLRFAPFQLLASEGAAHQERPHAWHLDLADRLAATDPDLVSRTGRISVDVTDPDSTAAATAWWAELTGRGGEGMVVKPAANLTRSRRGLVQPGLKVRGREYLRIIYGPDYTEPPNLERLRERGLNRKRNLAVREYALGLDALTRLAGGEPLWRIHESVFAVLALESEPVDPRL